MTLRIGAALLAIGLLIPVIASAQEIRACVSNKTGALRIVATDTACKSGETLLKWNTQGPAGPTTVFGVTVTPGGNGIGTVQSNDGEIDCGADCTEVYPAGTMVELVATAGAGSTFAGWGGDCSGTGSCVLTMNATKAVVAQFQGEPCTPGATRLCSKQHGVCQGSVMVCPSSGAWPADCDYTKIAGYSETELCDALDNDCNGTADLDAFPTLGQSCSGLDAQSACRVGTNVCSVDKTATVCLGTGGILTPAQCTP
jgi:hypothetical protein